jgi:CubicO group peptidase (beta-lactamase class C family)
MSKASDPTTGSPRLFSGEPQYERFSRMQLISAVSELKASQQPFQFSDGPRIDLPTTYTFDGRQRNLHSLLGATHTSALLVLKDGAVRYEQYWLTGGRNVQWMSMSVAKSFTSALVGIALSDGSIKSLQDPIDRYVPKLAGSAFEGVSIKDVLQMSSGARFNEDYSDPTAEIHGLTAALGTGGSLDEFVSRMVRQTTPGTVCVYSSGDTQALGMLIAGATGRSITHYMQETLYEPLGMESPGYWILDSVGREMVYGGVLMTARDFAKLGELYRNGGNWNGRQVVPSEYVAASIKADAPHLMPGGPMEGGLVAGPGYGYQWWLPEGDLGDFTAMGVYNQFVYVDPSRGVVIVKLSANPAYGTSQSEEDNKDNENIAALRAICRQFD